MALSLDAVLYMMRNKDDVIFFRNGVKELEKRYGKEIAEKTERVLFSADEDAYNNELNGLWMLSMECEHDILPLLTAVGNSRGPLENQAEQKIIMELYHSDDGYLMEKAQELMIKKNEHYIYSILKEKFPTFLSGKDEVDSLVNSGRTGVIMAMRTFDADAGSFLTFAHPYIIHEIVADINFSRNITSHFERMQRKIIAAESRLTKMGLPVTIAALAELTKLKPMYILQEKRVMDMQKGGFSLSDDEAPEVEDSFRKTPEEAAIENERTTILYEALGELDPVVSSIVYGKAVDKKNYSKLSAELGITLENVKTLYNKGIVQLKKNMKLRNLYEHKFSEAERKIEYYNSYMENTAKVSEEEKLMANMDTLSLVRQFGLEERTKKEGRDGLQQLADSLEQIAL